MATRVRESGVKGKEKKGSQADQTMPQQHKRTTTTTTATTTASRLMSSVPNYLRPTTASSAVQAAGDKPHPSRRKSLDRPLPHLDTHRNLAGDKPSPARRKSLDRPIVPPQHSPLSSSSSSSSHKPTFSRTKSSLDKPKSSSTISRASEANDRRAKMMTRSISSIAKSSSSSSSSSSIGHHHLKPLSDRPAAAIAKTHKNSTRKQPAGTTLSSSSKTAKKKPAAETILTNHHHHHQEPSVPATESPDNHNTEVSANPDPNQTEIINTNNNSSSSSKIVLQEKENINVVVGSDDEELENLKAIEDCSSCLLSEDPIDLLGTITEEGDDEEPNTNTNTNTADIPVQESADTITPEDPQVEDNKDLKETITNLPADYPKSPDEEFSVEEKGDETNMQPSFHSYSNSNSSEENQEEEEEKEKETTEKKDNHELAADEQVKEEITDDHNNNNINNNNNNNNNGFAVPAHQQSPEAKPALKRNESVVSNDVIEETASKLREQRKNKVKALAGAFETVISLQDK